LGAKNESFGKTIDFKRFSARYANLSRKIEERFDNSFMFHYGMRQLRQENHSPPWDFNSNGDDRQAQKEKPLPNKSGSGWM
jgi:hypothetical protein